MVEAPVNALLILDDLFPSHKLPSERVYIFIMGRHNPAIRQTEEDT
jgi:hypothetical protein